MKRDDLKERILDVAMDLAAEGGFENVKQRDVAAGAGIALGTLYKRFRSKEDILSALLEREAGVLERRLARKPPRGETEVERVIDYYRILTRTLCRKPPLAKAMLRAMASGDRHTADNVTRYHGLMIRLVVRALHGCEGEPPTPRDLEVAALLQNIWFAALVGWSAGYQSQREVNEMVDRACAIILAGVDARGES